eukprot:14841602-Alexandrium_andersonii.AAC.1
MSRSPHCSTAALRITGHTSDVQAADSTSVRTVTASATSWQLCMVWQYPFVATDSGVQRPEGCGK